MKKSSLIFVASLIATPAFAIDCFDSIEIARRQYIVRGLDLMPLNGFGDEPFTEMPGTPYLLSPIFTDKNGKKARCVLKHIEFGTLPTIGSMTDPIDCFELKDDR